MAVLLTLLFAPGRAAWAKPGQPIAGIFPPPASSEEKEAPLSQEQAFKMLQAGVPSAQIEGFAREDGIDFKVTPAMERDLRKAGASARLILLLKKLSTAAVTAHPKAPAASSESSALLVRADDALTRKDYPEAVKALKTVIATQPDMVPAWFDLGFAYNGLHEPDEAVKAYQKTLELAPDHFLAQLDLGVLFLEQKQTQAALEHLQKATALKPENARGHLNYAHALAQTNQPEAARKEFGEASRLDPSQPTAQYELGHF
jgi:tetratricopeptide (TPR) repeat protein